MKTKILIIICIIMLIAIGVHRIVISENNSAVYTMTGVVEGMNEHTVKVKITNDGEYNNNLVTVYINEETKIQKNNENMSSKVIKKGDVVEIIFDGAISELNPPKINNCFAIKIIS